LDLHAPGTRPDRFGRAQGLPSGSISDVVLQGDRVWVICGPDVVSLPISEITAPTPRVPLIILAVKGNDQPGEGAVPHFDHAVERITITLRDHDYVRHGEAPFRYRTSPAAGWSTSLSPEIQLVGLDPGSYRLEIQAVDAEGVWGPSVFAAWVIEAPFWARPWFIALLVALSITLLFVVARYLRERRHRELRLASEKLRYHHKALLAQMEPHFIFNALNSIQGFVASNHADVAARYIAKFARLMRSLLNAAHSEEVSLAEEVSLLEDYCALEALRFAIPFGYRITTSSDLDPHAIRLPSFLVQPYVENAIRHGLRELQGERPGSLSIRFESEPGDRLRCTVEDNGVGRAQARKRGAQGDGWRSLGTAINNERLPLLSQMGSDIRIDTEDLSDETG
ncbi:MAG: histidine kinase, partial [Flavobacteriales bacterium]|nr:histidine kinase [Flavobacteriales bacterium]